MFEVSKREDEQSDREQHEDSLIWSNHTYHGKGKTSRRFKLFYAIYQVLLAHRGLIVEFSLSIMRTDDTCVEILYLEDNIPANDNSTIFELFESLPLIQNRSITSSFIEYFADDVVLQVLPTALIRLKYCYLSDICFLDSPRLPFLLLIIRSFPNLKKLKISFMSELAKVYTQAEIDAVKPQDYSDIRLEHLNKLKIINLSNFKPKMVFLKHILANSPVLKKASIVLDSMVAKNEHLQISRILSHYPCASPVVDISVKHSD
uniref:FBD domain-containing protein n=1 Tax=Tanacetum cinerariifolium TaxID=118510 RepID=A0A6L2J3U1_TANCI|nr:hypothetical protein [Tanacetum cinerariifolium]